TSSPPMRILPAVGVSSPAIMRSEVVLPQPEGPSRHTNSPSPISKLTSPTAVKSPKRLVTFSNSTDAMRLSLDAAEEAEAELPANAGTTRRGGQRIHERIGRQERDARGAGFRIERQERGRGRHVLAGAQQDEGDEEAPPDIDEAPHHDDHDAGPDDRQGDREK